MEIPPEHPVASVIGFLKGEERIVVARLCGKERSFTSGHFWADVTPSLRSGVNLSESEIHPLADLVGRRLANIQDRLAFWMLHLDLVTHSVPPFVCWRRGLWPSATSASSA
jgi:hypothetical protein